jgi:hypothetical protein
MSEPLIDEIGFDMVKRGESTIRMLIRRSMGGLTMTVKIHPEVEKFFRDNSAGEPYDVRASGRHWTNLDKDTPLYAYQLADPIPIIQLDGARRVRFDKLGAPLITQNGGGDAPAGLRVATTDINMGFLRLIGAGEDSGKTFRIRGVFSDPAVEEIRDFTGEAAKKFYQTYLRPINLSVNIVTQEW